MKKQILGLMFMVLMLSPVTGFAMKDMDHGKEMVMEKVEKMDHHDVKEMDHDDKQDMDHHDMKGMDHGSMKMDGKMIMLQSDKVEGVTGAAHLMDVKEAMEKHGMKMTHHIMMNFSDAAGETLDKGQVAVKIEDPDGNISDAITMMGMDGHFGADINLDKKGMYHFKIGTKLADGTKRMYHMHFENE